jgi:hypothetical protein
MTASLEWPGWLNLLKVVRRSVNDADAVIKVWALFELGHWKNSGESFAGIEKVEVKRMMRLRVRLMVRFGV